MKSLAVFILLCVLSISSLHSQQVDTTRMAASILSEQESVFVNYFINEYNKNIGRFKRKVVRNLDKLDKNKLPSDFTVLYIPIIMVRSKAPAGVESMDFLKYISREKLRFCDAVVYDGSDAILELSSKYVPAGKKMDVAWCSNDYNVIKEMNPDYVFTVGGLLTFYFIIKDSKLYVLHRRLFPREYIKKSEFIFLPLAEFLEKADEFLPYPFKDSYFNQKKIIL